MDVCRGTDFFSFRSPTAGIHVTCSGCVRVNELTGTLSDTVRYELLSIRCADTEYRGVAEHLDLCCIVRGSYCPECFSIFHFDSEEQAQSPSS